MHFLLIRRSRNVNYEKSPYEIVPNTLNTNANYITVDVVNKENGHLFVLKLEGLKVDLKLIYEKFIIKII
jgi:hypothetical protein